MKKAFTLAEVMICMAIIGTLGVVMLKTLSNPNLEKKEFSLKAHKAMRLIDETSMNIAQNETSLVPAGAFMINVAGTDTFVTCSVVNSATGACSGYATASNIRDLFAKYIKFESQTNNFKNDSTGYAIPTSATTIYGGKISGDIHIGFETFAAFGIENCQSPVYIPQTEATNGTIGDAEQRTVSRKCWGKVYIDVNGKKGPNTLGKDVYIFGLAELGIAK